MKGLLAFDGMSGVPRRRVSLPCRTIDERVAIFLRHALEGDWPDL
jgi:hypothetical protein